MSSAFGFDNDDPFTVVKPSSHTMTGYFESSNDTVTTRSTAASDYSQSRNRSSRRQGVSRSASRDGGQSGGFADFGYEQAFPDSGVPEQRAPPQRPRARRRASIGTPVAPSNPGEDRGSRRGKDRSGRSTRSTDMASVDSEARRPPQRTPSGVGERRGGGGAGKPRTRSRRASMHGAVDNFAQHRPSPDQVDYGYGYEDHQPSGFGDFSGTSQQQQQQDDYGYGYGAPEQPRRQRAARRSSIDVSKLASDVRSGAMDIGAQPNRQQNIAVAPMVMPDTKAGPAGHSRRMRRGSLVGAVGAVGGAVGGMVGGAVGGTLGAVGAVTGAVTGTSGQAKSASRLSDDQDKKGGKGFFKDRNGERKVSRTQSTDDNNIIAAYTGSSDRRRMGALKVGERDSGDKGSKVSYSDRIMQKR